jgi:hypothetical protein
LFPYLLSSDSPCCTRAKGMQHLYLFNIVSVASYKCFPQLFEYACSSFKERGYVLTTTERKKRVLLSA